MQLAVVLSLLLVVPVRGAQVEVNWWIGAGLVALGLAMGLCAGLFGVGGGIVAVPVLIVLFGTGDLMARGISLLAMMPTALSGTIANLRQGLVRIPVALTTGFSAMAASLLGVQAAAAVPPRAGSIAFAGLVVVSAVQLIRKTLRQ